MYQPKKFLLWTFHELRELLASEDDTDLSSLKFSTLYRYVKSKKEFIAQGKIPGISCLCPDCENLELLLEGISKSECDIGLPTKCHDIVDRIACNPLTEKCVDGSCSDCPVLDLDPLLDCETVNFHQWEKGTKYYEKKAQTKSGEELHAFLPIKLTELKGHYYRKRTQSAEYRRQIEQLAEGEVLIHVDYAENYKNKQQNEIKAAYYGQGQFSLYTVVVYMKVNGETKCKSFGLVTEENDHSCNVSFALNNFLINMLKAEHGITTIKFWSDGCASQFRSQFAFYMLSKLDRKISIEWHFFESNHGKGSVDGIGGTIKHAVFRKVLAKQVVITSPQEFAKFADTILPTITVRYMSDEDLVLHFHEECRANSVYVYGTLQVHCVRRNITGNQCQLNFYKTSTSECLMKSVVFNCSSAIPVAGSYYHCQLRRLTFSRYSYHCERRQKVCHCQMHAESFNSTRINMEVATA